MDVISAPFVSPVRWSIQSACVKTFLETNHFDNSAMDGDTKAKNVFGNNEIPLNDKKLASNISETKSLITRMSSAIEKFSWTKQNSSHIESQNKRNASMISSKSGKKLHFFRSMWRRVTKKKKQNESVVANYTITKAEDLEQLLSVCVDVMEYLECQRLPMNLKSKRRQFDEDTFTVWDFSGDETRDFKQFVGVNRENSVVSESTKLALESGILKQIVQASERESDWVKVDLTTFEGFSTDEHARSTPSRMSAVPTDNADSAIHYNYDNCSILPINQENSQQFEHRQRDTIKKSNCESYSETCFPPNAVNLWYNGANRHFDDSVRLNNEENKEKTWTSEMYIELATNLNEEICVSQCGCDCLCHQMDIDMCSEDSLDLESLHLGTNKDSESSVFVPFQFMLESNPPIFADCPSLNLMATNNQHSTDSKSSTLTELPSSTLVFSSLTMPLNAEDCSKECERPKCKGRVVDDDAEASTESEEVIHEAFGGLFRVLAEYIYQKIFYNPLVKRFW